jgi:hypothetical protein
LGDIALKNSFVFLSSPEYGDIALRAVNVSDPDNPRLVDEYDYSIREAMGISVNGNRIYLADYNQGFIILERN